MSKTRKWGYDKNDERNLNIFFDYHYGQSVSLLADGYDLTAGTIRTILKQVEENIKMGVYVVNGCELYKYPSGGISLLIYVDIYKRSKKAHVPMAFEFNFKAEGGQELLNFVMKELMQEELK